jgi:HSP20 family protein
MFVRRVWSSGSKAAFRSDNRHSTWAAGARQVEAGLFPPLDITQDDENVYVRAEMPGIRPDELSISTLRQSLSLAGKHALRPDAERSETARSFSCTVVLPAEVDAERVDAGYCDGVLTLTLSKRTCGVS